VGKALLYIVYVTLFLNTASLDQFHKLPKLVSHYLEHEQTKQGLSIFQFIAMHYWGNDNNDQDNERDMQLPCKKIDVNNIHSFTVPTGKTVVIVPEWSYSKHISPTITDNIWVNPTLSALFRPPKSFI